MGCCGSSEADAAAKAKTDAAAQAAAKEQQSAAAVKAKEEKTEKLNATPDGGAAGGAGGAGAGGRAGSAASGGGSLTLGGGASSRRLDSKGRRCRIGVFPAGAGLVEITTDEIFVNPHLLEKYRGNDFSKVDDQFLSQLVSPESLSTKGKVSLEEIELVDLSLCDKVTSKGLEMLLTVCPNVRALHMFPVPRGIDGAFPEAIVKAAMSNTPLSLVVASSDSPQVRSELAKVVKAVLEITKINSNSDNGFGSSSSKSGDYGNNLRRSSSTSVSPSRRSGVSGTEPTSNGGGLTSSVARGFRKPREFAQNWVTLGNCIMPPLSSIYVGNRNYTEQECYQQALSLCPNECRALYSLAVSLAGQPRDVTVAAQISADKTAALTRRELFLASIASDPTNSYAWNGLGLDLAMNEVLDKVAVGGGDGELTNVGRRECFLKAIECHKENAFAWNYLGNTLKVVAAAAPAQKKEQEQPATLQSVLSNGDAELADHATQQQLQQQLSGEHSLSNAAVAGSSGSTSAPAATASGNQDHQQQQQQTQQPSAEGAVTEESVVVPALDNKVLTKTQCYVRAVEINPSYSRAWNNLGAVLSATGVPAVLVSGQGDVSKRECYLRAVRCDANDAVAWTNLASTLKTVPAAAAADGEAKETEDEKVALVESDPNSAVTKRDCLIQALIVDPTYKPAWRNLCNILESGESVMVGGVIYSKIDCFRRGK